MSYQLEVVTNLSQDFKSLAENYNFLRAADGTLFKNADFHQLLRATNLLCAPLLAGKACAPPLVLEMSQHCNLWLRVHS